jgi:RNA polymerase sigma-70 factor, ECF subfamily
MEKATKKFPEEAAISCFGKPEEAADLMAYMVSTAAKLMTGASVRMDGGAIKRHRIWGIHHRCDALMSIAKTFQAEDIYLSEKRPHIYEPLSGIGLDRDPTTDSQKGPFMESCGLQYETPGKFTYPAATDDALVAAAKSGEQPAFVELWTRHSKTAFNMAYRITGNRDDAEDVVQDAWMKAYAHLNAFDGRSKFSTWLSRIAINSALMILRRRRARPETSMEITDGDTWQHWETADQTKSVDELYARQEALERLRWAICRLQPALRNVIEIHQSNGSSVKETAELAGISVAATKSRLMRARKILLRALT